MIFGLLVAAVGLWLVIKGLQGIVRWWQDASNPRGGRRR